jgi:hypothetical protein
MIVSDLERASSNGNPVTRETAFSALSALAIVRNRRHDAAGYFI